MSSHRWSNVILPHTVLHCGYGGEVDRTVMWCSRKEFHVLNSWEIAELSRKSEKSSALADSEYVCLTVDQSRHTLSTVYLMKWLVVHTVAVTFWLICISTHLKIVVSQLNYMTLFDALHHFEILCWVNGAWKHVIYIPQWQTYTQTVIHENLWLGLHCKVAPVVLFLHSLLNSETRDLTWRKMLNNGVLKKMIIKKSKVKLYK